MKRKSPILLIIEPSDSITSLIEQQKSFENAITYRQITVQHDFADILTQESYALILCDVDYSDIEVSQIIQAVKNQQPETPLILIATDVSLEKAIDAMRLGARGYVEKHNHPYLIKLIQQELEIPHRAEQKQYTKTVEEMQLFLQNTLDAISSQIAVLNPDGTIINTNLAWKKFGLENGATEETDNIGENYLEIAQTAVGIGSEESILAFRGIYAVIHGHKQNFYQEYPCDTPQAKRAFAMQVTPFNETIPRRVVVTHTDISERRNAQEALQRAHANLEQRVVERTHELNLTKNQVETILNNSPDAILLAHADLSIQQVNSSFNILFGCEADAYFGKSLLTLIHPNDTKSANDLLQIVSDEPNGKRIEVHAIRNDGTSFEAELSIGRIIKGDGLVCIIRDINERKAQERQLRYHASIQASMSDAVIATDMDLRIQSWNKAAQGIYGWTAEEVIGKVAPEFLQIRLSSDYDPEADFKQFNEHGFIQQETIQRHKDGTDIFIFGSATRFEDEKGVPSGIIAVNQDITERKRIAEALQKSAAEIHDLYNNAPCGYHSIDKNGVIVQINDTELQWLGYTRDEVIGKLKITDIFTPESVKLFQNNFSIFMEQGWISDLEFEVMCKDGSTKHILLNATAIYDDDGQYLKSRSTLFDIMKLQQAQQAIVESETRYRLLAENISDVIAETNLDGIRTFITPSCYALLGYTSDELIGQSSLDIVHPDDRSSVVLAMIEALSTRKTSFSVIHRFLHKAGHDVWVEVTNNILYDQDPTNNKPLERIKVIRNITERKQQERQLRYHASLQESVSDAVIVTDTEFRIQSWNKAAESIYGWSATETIGKLVSEILPTTYQSEADGARITQDFLEQGAWQGEVIQLHRDGRPINILASTNLFKDDTGQAFGVISVNRDITERKQQERQLRYHASLQESVSDAVIVTDTEFRIQSWNKAAESIYGWSATETIGKLVSEILPTTYQSEADGTHIMQDFLEHGAWQGEVIQLHRDGRPIHILASTNLFKDDTGQAFGVISVNRDITERKQAEEQIRSMTERLRMATEAGKIGIWDWDIVNNAMVWDDQMYKLYGIEAKDFTGTVEIWNNLLHPDDAARAQAEVEAAIRGEKSFDTEFRIMTPDGNTGHIRAQANVYHDKNNTAYRMIGVNINITRQKAVELALRESEEKFRTFIESAPIATIISNMDGQIVLVNNAAEQLFDYERSELIGKSIQILIPDNLRERYQLSVNDFAKLDHPERSEAIELLARHKNGHNIPVDIKLSRVQIKPDALIMAYIVDITHRKQAEDALRHALVKEKELGDLKTRFVSMASHEFRTPLATILALVETLSAYRHKLPEDQIELRFGKIKDQVGHLKDIMEDVLMLARLQARRVEFNPVRLNLDALTLSVLDEFASRGDVVHRLEYNAGNGNHEVWLDRKLMRQIISNLVSNAIKYSPESKVVRISLEYTDLAVTLKVSDEGIGIPEADLPHLFEPFHRAANVGAISGTGLGLVITRDAVELHGGTISVESHQGVGTTFIVHIPIST